MKPYDALYKLFGEWLPERDLEKTCVCGELKDEYHPKWCTNGSLFLPHTSSPFFDWLKDQYHICACKDACGDRFYIYKMNCSHAITGCSFCAGWTSSPRGNIDDLIDFKNSSWTTTGMLMMEGWSKQDEELYHTVPIFNANGITMGYMNPSDFFDAIMNARRLEFIVSGRHW
jgi:hypothetical protein